MADDSSPPHDIPEGDTYHHADGTIEIVFARAEGKVLTVREYEGSEQFESAVGAAEYSGTHDGVASLPDAEYFVDGISDDAD